MPTRLRGDNFDWNEAHITEVKRLHAEGNSPGAIQKLWKNKQNAPSRSAIMAKLSRLGLIGDLEKRKKNKAKPRQHRRHHNKSDGISAATTRKPGGYHSLGFKRLSAVTAPPPNPVSVKRDAAREAARALLPVKLESGHIASRPEHLSARMCKYPIGDPLKAGFGYCGRDQTAGKPYCKDHALLSYSPRAAA